ncbi:hypothetical protein DXX97_11335 [Lactococcus lactis]|nr:hypothetical protein [Lactococcus lactis]
MTYRKEFDMPSIHGIEPSVVRVKGRGGTNYNVMPKGLGNTRNFEMYEREQVVQLLHELTALNLGINDFEECSKIVERFIKD